MNLNQYIKNRVQNILNERLIQNAQSNINNNIDNAAKRISSVIRYSSIVENIMSMHITDEQLQTLVCEAFKYFDTLPDVFEDSTYDADYYLDNDGYHLKQDIDFQDSFESNIKRLMEETGPDDPNIRKLLTSYAYCCKWANINPFDEYYSSLSKKLEITTTYDLDYTDEFDIIVYNSETVIALSSNEKKQIIINNILEEFFDEERFKSWINDDIF